MGKATIRSVAAVLLVVAVLAGSCASGADAQFNISSICNSTLNVVTGISNITVPANATVAVTVPPIGFFVGGLSVTLTGGTTPVTIVVPPFVVTILRLFGIFLRNLTVFCFGNCILLIATLQIPLFPPIPLQYGPFCA